MSVGLLVCQSVGRPYFVWMITRHRIDVGSSNLAQTWVLDGRLIFDVNWSKVKVTVTVNMMIYRPNPVWMKTRHRIDLGLSNLVQIWVSERR